jgi:hypothetical protein
MERIILGDTNFYFSQCRGKKFFTGKSRADALFLFDRRTKRFCIGEIVVQLVTYVIDEFTQSRLCLLCSSGILW